MRLHRVFRCAVKLLDPQMLLDPLEEEFHLPAAFVQSADGGGRKGEVVGDEHQSLAGLGVLEADAPQNFGVSLTGVETVQRDGLVANDAGREIRRRRVDAMSIHVRLGAIHKEGPSLMQPMTARPSPAKLAPMPSCSEPIKIFGKRRNSVRVITRKIAAFGPMINSRFVKTNSRNGWRLLALRLLQHQHRPP